MNKSPRPPLASSPKLKTKLRLNEPRTAQRPLSSYNKPSFMPKNLHTQTEHINNQGMIMSHSSELEFLSLSRPKQKIRYHQTSYTEDYYCYQVLVPNRPQKSQVLEKLASPPKHKNCKLKQTTSTSSQQLQGKFSSNAPRFLKGKNTLARKFSNGYANLRIQDFEVIKKLGEGKFGKVYLVRQKSAGIILAIKTVQKRNILEANLLNQFIRELKIQSSLNHPGIIKIYGFFHDELHFHILLELGCDGQLYAKMSQSVKTSEETASFICRSTLQALNYMHMQGILHRDIKPQNIVLIHGAVKLCDFGWAVKKSTKNEMRATFCGTPLYLSPQLIKGINYDQKVDIWAAGILTYELLMNNSPFQIQKQQDLHRIVTSDIYYPRKTLVSKEFKSFMEAILMKDASRRPDGEQLLGMEFIRGYGDLQTCEQLCR